MTLLARKLADRPADDLHRDLLRARREGGLSKTDELTLLEAWFRASCREGTPPDRLDRARPRSADIHRFWELVDTTTSPEGCWIWKGTWTRERYSRPSFRAGGRNYPAKRFAYEIDFGEAPPEMMVVPLCGNRACVRPEHLEERPNHRYSEQRRTWSKEALIAAMQAFHAEHGRPPLARDWPRATDTHPGFQTLVQHFGGVNASRRAAGLPEIARGGQQTPKTSCKRGHPFEGANLSYARDGARVCKTCQSIRAAASYARRHGRQPK